MLCFATCRLPANSDKQRSSMKFVITTLAVVAISLLTYLVGEGIYSLSRGNQPGWSLGHLLYQRVVETTSVPGGTPDGRNAQVIHHESQFYDLMEDFIHDGVAIGNSPFHELKKNKAAVNKPTGKCPDQKPNLNKTFTYLRTLLFEPFNPPLMYFDTERELAPAVRKFADTYGMRPIVHRTNDQGERLTLPYVDSDRKAIVAGDSVANGVGIMDSETISSQLQLRDRTLQYVNIGQGGATGEEILCKLGAAGERYDGQIHKLVYVYCENDLREDEPYGQPEEVIAWIQEFARDQGIDDIVIVFSPYVFNVFPEITRIPGTRGWDHKYRSEKKQQLKQLTLDAGYQWIDVADLAIQAQDDGKSVFAGLSLFVDLLHLSPLGTEKLAKEILPNG